MGKRNKMDLTPLTKEQAIVLTGFTGRTCCKFSDFHADVEKRLGHRVLTHEFADKDMMEKIKSLYLQDFMILTSEI